MFASTSHILSHILRKMTIIPLLALTIIAFGISTSPSANANEFAEQLNSIVESDLKTWITSPDIVSAIEAQNKKHANLTQEDIDALDKKWREQAGTGGDLVDGVLSNDLSKFLSAKKESSGGLFTEIFVVDNLGLNVGQSDVTSDYWQGDEAKWKVPMASREVHLGEIEQDESTQAFQSQINAPIIVNDEVIGTITVGVNLEAIQ